MLIFLVTMCKLLQIITKKNMLLIDVLVYVLAALKFIIPIYALHGSFDIIVFFIHIRTHLTLLKLVLDWLCDKWPLLKTT